MIQELVNIIYFKVKKEYDQFLRRDRSILIAGELYTANEVKKLNIDKAALEKVEVSKQKVYFLFGARFES